MDKRHALKANSEQAERLHHFAHDLRNRLAGMQQVLAQLGAATADPEQVEFVHFAEQQYFKAMRSTEELLDDLGVDRGPGTLRKTNLDLTVLVHKSIADLQHRFQRKQQRVAVSTTGTTIVEADAHWIEQLVQALLTNASKFTPNDGGIAINIAKERNTVVLSVTDSGVGMDREDLDHVFQRYAWLKSRTTHGEPQGRSTLARAREWARAHGGELQAHSNGPGTGCTFQLTLPSTVA